MAIELLLRQSVPALGKRGSIVKVKSGYARNYLIPKGIAVVATKENMRLLEVEKKKLAQEEALQKEELIKMAKELESVACNIETKANDDGHLFGSVTYAMISESFKKNGYNFEASSISLKDKDLYPIKELGIFDIEIQLHPEVSAKSKVWVVNETSSSE